MINKVNGKVIKYRPKMKVSLKKEFAAMKKKTVVSEIKASKIILA